MRPKKSLEKKMRCPPLEASMRKMKKRRKRSSFLRAAWTVSET